MIDHRRQDASPSADRLDQEIWDRARRFTPARISLTRSGASLATAPLLEFRLAHAIARDAVHAALEVADLRRALEGLGLPILTVPSAAQSRRDYLLRPDLGRRLSSEGADALAPHAGSYDLVFVLADGLSATAIARHALPLLQQALPLVQARKWRLAPLVIVERGRVGIGDRIANLLGARAVVVLIGERPGLSAPDSLGLYMTWQPGPGTTDADRNCISNVRPAGLSYADAAYRLTYLLQQMFAVGHSGVRLKDNSSDSALPSQAALNLSNLESPSRS
ncbi:Ethanolamine ammonia-lyase light chain [Enhydrobacter aerosaccus]|uniref:Ethanolamine ammonia-lyase small subunit n=1 Tax=Enhydrobacter aerosaccus TaxID=225324 RepID=A0A1T4RMP4_9HYPH|nr:ethanolamine ammonia-lyase subunit EutC [Enhydrobacter aerosaccus]SKA17066.1 Ethanolamine ammonia-lyase light chain [Enhydrobacter aerosaccus]